MVEYFKDKLACSYFNEDLSIINAARPFKIVGNNKKAVILIHGHLGYPGELYRPAVDLAENGFDVYVPRLPGMGTSKKYALRIRYDICLEYLVKFFKKIRKQYSSIDIVGHSAGSVLAVLLAKKVKCGRLVLAAPAFSLPYFNPYKLYFASLFTKAKKIAWKSDPSYNLHYEGENDDEKLGKEYWSYIFPHVVLSLLSVQHKALKCFKNLKNDTLVLACENDVLTDIAVLPELLENKKGNNELYLVKDATHFVFYDINPKAEENAVDKCLEFLLK